jgi:hypothetical protein
MSSIGQYIEYSVDPGSNYSRSEFIKTFKSRINQVDDRFAKSKITTFTYNKFPTMMKPFTGGADVNSVKVALAKEGKGLKILKGGVAQPKKKQEIGIQREQVSELVTDLLENFDTTSNQLPLPGMIDGQVTEVGYLELPSENDWATADVFTLHFNYGIPELAYDDLHKLTGGKWQIPIFTHRPRYVAYDSEILDVFTDMFKKGIYPSITDGGLLDSKEFVTRWDDLCQIGSTTYCGTGPASLQIVRRERVEKQNQLWAKPEKRNFDDYCKFMNARFPVSCYAMDFTSLDVEDWDKYWDESGFPGTLYKINMGSNTGPWSLDGNGKQSPNGGCLTQNVLLCNWLMSTIDSGANTDYYDWAGLNLLMPKAEVYARTKGYIRNYYCFNAFAMRPMMCFLNTTKMEYGDWDGENNIVISGNTLFRGGLDKLIQSMVEYCVSKGKPAYAVYSDNLTIVYEDKDKSIKLLSVDGARQESCILRDLVLMEIKRLIVNFKQSGGKMSDAFYKYLTEIFPRWGVEGYSLLGDQFIKNNNMGSGIPGTFWWNTALTLRVVQQLQGKNITEFLNHSLTTTLKFSDKYISAMKAAGVEHTIESYVQLWPYKGEQEVKLDILGFSGYVITQIEPPSNIKDLFYIPRLQKDRFLKMMLYDKKGAQIQRDGKSLKRDKKSFIVKFVANLSRMVSAYVLYAWSDPYWSYIVRRRIANLLGTLRMYIRQMEKEGVKIEETIAAIKANIEAETDGRADLSDQTIATIMRLSVNMLGVPPLWNVLELLVTQDYADKIVEVELKKQTINPAFLVPIDQAERFGVLDAVEKFHATEIQRLWDKENFEPKLDDLHTVLNILKIGGDTRKKKIKFVRQQPVEPELIDIPDVVRGHKVKPQPSAEKMQAFDKFIKFLTGRKSKLKLLVPIPVNYREVEVPDRTSLTKIVWDRLLKDIATFFQIDYNIVKTHTRTIARVIEPHWRVPPNDGIVTNFADYYNKVDKLDESQYRLNYLGYTHQLFISESTTLFPRIDFTYYQSYYGLNKDEVQDLIRKNEPIKDSGRRVKETLRRARVRREQLIPAVSPGKTIEDQRLENKFQKKEQKEMRIAAAKRRSYQEKVPKVEERTIVENKPKRKSVQFGPDQVLYLPKRQSMKQQEFFESKPDNEPHWTLGTEDTTTKDKSGKVKILKKEYGRLDAEARKNAFSDEELYNQLLNRVTPQLLDKLFKRKYKHEYLEDVLYYDKQHEMGFLNEEDQKAYKYMVHELMKAILEDFLVDEHFGRNVKVFDRIYKFNPKYNKENLNLVKRAITYFSNNVPEVIDKPETPLSKMSEKDKILTTEIAIRLSKDLRKLKILAPKWRLADVQLINLYKYVDGDQTEAALAWRIMNDTTKYLAVTLTTDKMGKLPEPANTGTQWAAIRRWWMENSTPDIAPPFEIHRKYIEKTRRY